MKKISLIISLIVFSLSASAQNTWGADPYHSKMAFTVTHLGIADVPGHFEKFDVNIISSKPDFSDAKIKMTAQIASINTGVEPRDNHLRSADFFDAEKFPEMSFESTSIRTLSKNIYEVKGNLSLHGITKPVTVKMQFRGTTSNPNANGAPVAGIQITGTIKRSDFEIGNAFPPPMISNQVQIKADGEFGRK